MPSAPYRHVQRGTTILWSIAICAATAIAITLWHVSRAGTPPADAMGWLIGPIMVVCVLGVVAWYFSSMTVEVTDQELRWTVGRARPYSVPRSDIEGVSLVRHSFWQGYGTRWLGPNRWAYIVSGHDAVEVRLKDGGCRRIGTDDPQGLMAALGG
jgi:hypothetical protein